MKTLVKSKITLSADKRVLNIWIWKKTWWFFGYWYPFGSSGHGSELTLGRINLISDDAVSKALFENVITRATSQ